MALPKFMLIPPQPLDRYRALLGNEEFAEATLALNGAYLARLIQPGDVVYLHDPQSAGLVPVLRELGVKVIWRCHVGIDEPNAMARETWDFLRPYVEAADACIFSRREYVWEAWIRRSCG